MSDRYTRRIYLALAEGRDLSPEEGAHLRGCDACQVAADRAHEFEAQLHRELADLRRPLPADPMAAPDVEATRRPSLAFVGAVAAVVVVAVVLGGLLPNFRPDPAAGTPVPIPSSSGVAVATSAPSASDAAPTFPSPASSPPAEEPPTQPTPAPRVVQAGAYAIVALEGLAMRDLPDGEPFAVVNEGSEVYVLDARDGWYLIQAHPDYDRDEVFGWVPATTRTQAGTTDGAATLVPHDRGQCPEEGLPLLGALASEPAQFAVDCFGDVEEIRLVGYAIDVSPGQVLYGGNPDWLAQLPSIAVATTIGSAATGYELGVHLDPEREFNIPMSDPDGTDGIRVAMVGHFDDDRSRDCQRVPVNDGWPPMSDELSELWCRQRFVVERVEVIEPDTP